jgi:hypothetical protein
MTHDCPATRCLVRVGPEMLMCPAHWRMVPGPFRTAVWNAWRDGAGAGTVQHAAAIEAAVRSVNEKLAR